MTTLSSSDISSICDYIEYTAFLKGQCGIDSYYTDDDNADDEEASSSTSQRKDIKTSLLQRLKLYGSYKPYKLKGDTVISNFDNDSLRQQNLHYLFCLYYSLNGGYQSTRDITTLFERIVESAIKNYLNTPCSILTSFGNNDQTIKEKIHKLVQETKESIGDLSLMPAHAKDGGIDIVTYKPLDERGNQIIVLTDATIGKNWKEKHVYSKIQHWGQYIHFKNNPITCLAIAGIIPTENFHSASRDNGLLFDRTRIMGYYVPQDKIQEDLEHWRTQLCIS